jgi:hypothetical protein
MIQEWLTQKITVEEAGAQHVVHDDRPGPDPAAFGFQNEEWLAILRRMEPDDELWEFNSPPETWQNLCGRRGFAVVRDGEVVATILTVMN